jgi:hypothetical protein
MFLSEYRRRTFAACFYLDKVISRLFDRPPRILTRYSDCKMPLDLDDEELLGGAESIERARQNLTSDGWALTTKYHTTTWIRLRYIFGLFWEKVLEFSYREQCASNCEELKLVCADCRPYQIKYN